MLAPDNYENLSDEELLNQLTELYGGDKVSAEFVLSVLREKETSDEIY